MHIFVLEHVMDSVLARLLCESRALGTEEIAVLTYLMANAIHSQEQRERDERFRGKIFSTLQYDEVCSRFNMLDCTVKRIIKKFESIGWLKIDQDGVCLGEWTPDKKKFWYCAKNLGSMKEREPRKETATEQLRRLIQEAKHKSVDTKIQKLPANERSKILTDIKSAKNTTPGSRLLNTAKSCHVNKFHTAYPMSVDNASGRASYPKELGLWNRVLMYCNNDDVQATAVIEWAYKEWDTVKQKINWVGRAPNVSLFATKAYFQKILELRGEGYAKSLNVGDRYDGKAAESTPDFGYGT